MVCYGFFIVFVQCARVIAEKAFVWEMNTAGRRVSFALKVILFDKTIRMTTATNKDFSNNEISNITLNMTDRFWRALYIEINHAAFVPFKIIFALVVIYQQVGYSALIALLFSGLRILL